MDSARKVPDDVSNKGGSPGLSKMRFGNIIKSDKAFNYGRLG